MYVGVVLAVNGIWLIGQAQAAQTWAAAVKRRVPGRRLHPPVRVHLPGVSANQYLNAGGRAFGWYCLFVAITAIPTGIYTLQAAHGNTALIWLGINWFAWAVLWALFWALLVLELPIARIAGWLAMLKGVGTSWALAIAVLEGKLAF